MDFLHSFPCFIRESWPVVDLDGKEAKPNKH